MLAIQKGKTKISLITLILKEIMFYTIVAGVIRTGELKSIIAIILGNAVGTLLAMKLDKKLSKDRLYVYHCILNEEKADLDSFLFVLKKYKDIKVKITDEYDLDLNKVIGLTIFAETKSDSKIIEKLIKENSGIHKLFRQK